MKNIKEYIKESFKIGRNKMINISYNDLDNLTPENITIWEDKDPRKYVVELLNNLNSNESYYGFMSVKYPIMNIIDKPVKLFNMICFDENITNIISSDHGYYERKIILQRGRLIFDYGSYGKNYVYGLTKSAYKLISDWFDGKMPEEDIKKLCDNEKYKYIVPIEVNI